MMPSSDHRSKGNTDMEAMDVKTDDVGIEVRLEPFEVSDGYDTVSTKEEDEPAEAEAEQQDGDHRGWSPWRWTLFYASMFLFLTAISGDASTVVHFLNLVSFLAMQLLLFFCVCNGQRGRQRSRVSWKTRLGMLYVVGLSLLLSGVVAPATTTNWYARVYHWIRPCRTAETILHQLQYESSLLDSKIYRMQALGLDNDYAQKLGQALQVHFDRYGNNETKEFVYVRSLNLIGNLFDDRGASELVTALEHPHAYTTRLLLGRNDFLGDATAHRLAALIRKNEDESNTPQKLDWLEMGGTAVTSQGLSSLYHAMGTRTFSFLGLEYTDKPNYSSFKYLFRTRQSNPVAKSIPQLQHASLLQEISLTGNRLGNKDMAALTTSILQTNISKLGLTNNRIGPAGIITLAPLVTRQLTELQLGINDGIGDDGAVSLAHALTFEGNKTSNLESLTLFMCGIGQRGAEALLSIFPENTNVTSLLIFLPSDGRTTSIKPETLQAIEAAYTANWDDRL